MDPLQLPRESVVPVRVRSLLGVPCWLSGRGMRNTRALRRAGFVTPIGWVYLTLLLVLIVVVVSAFAWIIASANVTIAENVAELAATNGATLGLQFLITGTLPGTPIPVIALPEPMRTNEIAAYIIENALPGGALAKYLSPLEVADVVVTVSPVAPVSASITVTARAGRTGQFVSTVTRQALARAANRVESGRLIHGGNGATSLASGVLPLAVDLGAFEALHVPASSRDRSGGRLADSSGLGSGAWPKGPGRLSVTLGETAFAALPLQGSEQGELHGTGEDFLIASAEFLGYSGTGEPLGVAPPGFSVGQHLAFSSSPEKTAANGSKNPPAINETSGQDGEDSGAGQIDVSAGVVEVLLRNLEGRAVIVPLVKGQVIQGFAVATLQRRGASEIALEFLPSVLSPLARIEPRIDSVSARLSAASGLAMGLSVPGVEGDEYTESVIGDTLEIAG